MSESPTKVFYVHDNNDHKSESEQCQSPGKHTKPVKHVSPEKSTLHSQHEVNPPKNSDSHEDAPKHLSAKKDTHDEPIITLHSVDSSNNKNNHFTPQKTASFHEAHPQSEHKSAVKTNVPVEEPAVNEELVENVEEEKELKTPTKINSTKKKATSEKKITSTKKPSAKKEEKKVKEEVVKSTHQTPKTEKKTATKRASSVKKVDTTQTLSEKSTRTTRKISNDEFAKYANMLNTKKTRGKKN